jgi:hypothetical protein
MVTSQVAAILHPLRIPNPRGPSKTFCPSCAWARTWIPAADTRLHRSLITCAAGTSAGGAGRDACGSALLEARKPRPCTQVRQPQAGIALQAFLCLHGRSRPHGGAGAHRPPPCSEPPEQREPWGPVLLTWSHLFPGRRVPGPGQHPAPRRS